MLTKKKITIIGLVCLFIASKIEEPNFLDISNIMYYCEKEYSKLDILNLEHDILNKLDYCLYHETIIQHISTTQNINSMDKKDYDFCCLMAAATLTTIDHMFVEPSIMAKKIIEFCQIMDNEINENDDIFILKIYSETDHLLSYLFYHLQRLYMDDNLKDIIDNYGNDKYLNLMKYKMNPTNYPINGPISKYITIIRDTYVRISVISIKKIYSEKQIRERKYIGKLGSGTFGLVTEVEISGQRIALKKVYGETLLNGVDDIFLREINSLYLLSNPNIITATGIFYDHYSMSMYIGLELMKCTLKSYISRRRIPRYIKMKFILNLLDGLNYMHSQNIMHRDITYTNVLVSNNGQLKIADLGSARYFHQEGCNLNLSSLVCVLDFRAIELLLGKNPYSSKVDVWSAACVIAYILKEQKIFNPDNEKELVEEIFKIFGTPCLFQNHDVCTWPLFVASDKIWPRTGLYPLEQAFPEQTEILYKMFEYEPDLRINIAEALDLFLHSFRKY